MTPAARIAAAIEILDSVQDGTPAEKALTGWARASRYAGSKDRAAVRDHVFQALRCLRSYAVLGGAKTGRGIMIGALRATGDDPAQLFTGEGHAPAPLEPHEQDLHLAGEADTLNLPDWLWPEFEASLGDDARRAALDLQTRAPVMLRVNLRKASAQAAIDALADEAITAQPDPIADTALIATQGARKVGHSAAYRDGLVELQDGSSQAAMAALTITPGTRVLDFCAGGGGKVLALAARHDAKWCAHDALPQRMKDLPTRAGRAGVQVETVATHDLTGQQFDTVLCDVPCSGSGTWRRSPDAKWRFTPDDLAALERTQADILDTAQTLLAPGGTLAYATCSLLRRENEAQIEAFLARHPGWHSTMTRRWPVAGNGDGFFLAQLTQD